MNEKGLRMNKKKILIVDDEEDMLLVLAKDLAARGYSIITAGNGKEAMLLAKSERPDLVILDILMPGMDGLEVAARLKEDPGTRDLPVVFLTCLRLKEEEIKRGFVVDGDVMLAKPYDAEELATTIEELL